MSYDKDLDGKPLTKDMRKRVSNAFRIVQKYVYSGGGKPIRGVKYRYICHALRYVRDEACSSEDDMAARIAQNIIMKRLGHRIFSVEDWLLHSADIDPRHLTRGDIQEYRHRWLRALEAEFAADTAD